MHPRFHEESVVHWRQLNKIRRHTSVSAAVRMLQSQPSKQHRVPAPSWVLNRYDVMQDEIVSYSLSINLFCLYLRAKSAQRDDFFKSL